jgi:hypothetical protein
MAHRCVVLKNTIIVLTFVIFQVLISELGSEKELEKALEGEGAIDWEGRSSLIAKLQAQLDNHQCSESRPNSPYNKLSLPHHRGNGDGSSRQESLTPMTNLENSLTSVDKEAFKDLHLKFEESKAICQVSDVERERLGEHVRVVTKNLRAADGVMIASEAALRSERKLTAKLQKMLEKAHIELRDASSATSDEGRKNTSSSSTSGLSNLESLQEELEVTKEHLQLMGRKREADLDMYLKMASDSRRMFSQSLKEAVENL